MTGSEYDRVHRSRRAGRRRRSRRGGHEPGSGPMAGRYSRLYRDPEHGKCMGVLAGLADYLGVRVKFLRIAFILGCVFGWFIPLVPGYFILGFLLEPKPTDLYEDEEEEIFWRSVRARPEDTTVDLKQRLKRIDRRIQEMEAFLTSRRFRLDRELRGLEEGR